MGDELDDDFSRKVGKTQEQEAADSSRAIAYFVIWMGTMLLGVVGMVVYRYF
jgi:heme/copper-type cytochrome/quinol oxidase subunit 2